MSKRILFVSGSLGLGHIGRDLAIARELRRHNEDLSIDWLAASPADRVLLDAGENLLPEARDLGDETYELIIAYKQGKAREPLPFVMIYDFIGMDAVGWNPLERLGTYLWNRSWSRGGNGATDFADLSIFIGQVEDVPDRPFGPFLPNRREWAEARCEFVGYVLPFDPRDYGDRRALRTRQGYDPNRPLVVCSIGGTAIGRSLLELCGQAYPVVAERIPGLQMVLVSGPRLDPEVLVVPGGVVRKGYVPALHEHLASSDLAVVQGGGTLTLELTALARPFLYFPIPGHCEQEVHVAGRLRRHGAGVRMNALDTDPETLADAIIRHLGDEPDTSHVPVDGARVAAGEISRLL